MENVSRNFSENPIAVKRTFVIFNILMASWETYVEPMKSYVTDTQYTNYLAEIQQYFVDREKDETGNIVLERSYIHSNCVYRPTGTFRRYVYKYNT